MEEEEAAGSGVRAEKRQPGCGEKRAATLSSGGSDLPLVIRLRIKNKNMTPEDPMEEEEEAKEEEAVSGSREDTTPEDAMEEEEAGSWFREEVWEEMTPEECNAALGYLSALFEDYKVYADMTEEEVEDEYRRAGKHHRYDPETELHKRCARVAKKHPPPDGFDPRLKEFFKLIEDED